MSLPELFAALKTPDLPGARCRGRWELFDLRPGTHPHHVDLAAEAVAICQGCPALADCRQWAATLPRNTVTGVLAGTVIAWTDRPPKGEKETSTMTNTPISAALELIRYAKRTDDPVGAPTAVELATTGLDREQLTSLLRLLFPFVAELYVIARLSREAMDRRDAQTFAELTQLLGNLDDYDPDAYDSDPVGDIWRSATTDDSG